MLPMLCSVRVSEVFSERRKRDRVSECVCVCEREREREREREGHISDTKNNTLKCIMYV